MAGDWSVRLIQSHPFGWWRPTVTITVMVIIVVIVVMIMAIMAIVAVMSLSILLLRLQKQIAHIIVFVLSL